ncbi:hypothetical protein BDV26DRAFT_292109 [Aspergillus bertholletiae]|uniref:Uncharacterized protein n=1 Tax=Aspergillus bertholletiae TaxID=1226010 RepID=A0A5N7B9Z9_9EURO|nr:hypothetical protein BDV26DRAFT_292109 [Aspergillus bertholletiae]
MTSGYFSSARSLWSRPSPGLAAIGVVAGIGTRRPPFSVPLPLSQFRGMKSGRLRPRKEVDILALTSLVHWHAWDRLDELCSVIGGCDQHISRDIYLCTHRCTLILLHFSAPYVWSSKAMQGESSPSETS